MNEGLLKVKTGIYESDGKQGEQLWLDNIDFGTILTDLREALTAYAEFQKEK